jgi:hypothetical protein
MMEFDRILAKAETLVAERPMRTELTEAEISRCCSGWASAARPFMISRALAYQIPNACTGSSDVLLLGAGVFVFLI